MLNYYTVYKPTIDWAGCGEAESDDDGERQRSDWLPASQWSTQLFQSHHQQSSNHVWRPRLRPQWVRLTSSSTV